MQTLRFGSNGILVERLQRRLVALGFYHDDVNGDFTESTQLAVEQYQAANQLQVDGVVGRYTQGMLGLDLSDQDRVAEVVGKELDIALVQRICHDSSASNIRLHWPIIRQAMFKLQMGDNPMLLMAIATVYVETGRFCPLDEYQSIYNTTATGHPFDKYDDRHDLGNQGYPDGGRYKGRGYIQLTGRANYRDIGRRIGLQERLEQDPELANDPQIAADILAMFLKRAEDKVRQALALADLAQARKLVNGGSHGLPEFKRVYLLGEQLLV
ncbi:peptidoglycan-binding protein [Neptunicella sp. SCSIO 80796]|uniref:peptidoglycan-binding protein n=1 Tax=Neptunicella plasticusilytica TaxID=3117012 RepID=UPI003A4D5E16